MTSVEQQQNIQQEAVNLGTQMTVAEAHKEVVVTLIKAVNKSGQAPVEGLKLAHADAVAWLHRPHGTVADNIFQNLEQYFAMPREGVAYVLGAVWLVYMMIGGGAQFLSNLIGFVYPCYASVLAIRTEGQDDDTQWLIYWTTFASFFLVDAFASVFFKWFPFYFILKSAFLIYLWLPQTRGAQYLYKKYVNPAFTYIEKNWLSLYI